MIDRRIEFSLRDTSVSIELYAVSVLAENIYSSKVFAGVNLEDVEYCNLAKDMRNNPKTSWEITIAKYPALEVARQEALTKINAESFDFTYWDLLDAIQWSVTKDPDLWRKFIAGYESQGLSVSV